MHYYVTFALLLVAVTAFAGEPGVGERLYRRYCASCHGVGGRGDGPAAEALSPRPPDLTALTSTVPELMSEIDGSRAIRGHGSATMPVWGEVFAATALPSQHARRTALLTVREISEYVHGLRKGGTLR